jgi:hypothetical protein
MTAQMYEKGNLHQISITIIDFKLDAKLPRNSMDFHALEELAASIRLKGIIHQILWI